MTTKDFITNILNYRKQSESARCFTPFYLLYSLVLNSRNIELGLLESNLSSNAFRVINR